MSSEGLKFVGSLLASDVKQFLHLAVPEDYFIGVGEQTAYKAVRAHVQAYGVLPLPETLAEQGIALPTAEEPPEYYRDKLQHRYLHRNLKKLLLDAQDSLNAGDVEGAAEQITTQITESFFQLHTNQIIDFAQDGGRLVLDAFHQKAKDLGDSGLKFGWPTLDKMTGGLGGGDIISFVGRPGAGKTYMMLYGALSAWRAGATPLFISMEMKPLPIIQRLASMLTVIPITGLKDGFLTTTQLEKLGAGMGEAKTTERPFYVVDGNLTATPEDILLMARQVRPSVIFIDAAYLLRSSNKFLGRWERVTENIEFIKSCIAEALDIPVVISYQINREGGKKKAGKATLEDIAYTDAIGQISSVVMGLFEEPDHIEALIRRNVTILKGRNGETGEFSINWCFDRGPNYMDFSEIEEETTFGQLGYL